MKQIEWALLNEPCNKCDVNWITTNLNTRWNLNSALERSFLTGSRVTLFLKNEVVLQVKSSIKQQELTARHSLCEMRARSVESCVMWVQIDRTKRVERLIVSSHTDDLTARYGPRPAVGWARPSRRPDGRGHKWFLVRNWIWLALRARKNGPIPLTCLAKASLGSFRFTLSPLGRSLSTQLPKQAWSSFVPFGLVLVLCG